MSNLVWDWDYESLRRIIELLSFIGTTILGALGFFVFRQIGMAKDSLDTAKKTLEIMNEDMQTRIKREAVVFAVEQTRLFSENIITAVGKEIDNCLEIGLNFEPWKLQNANFDKTSFVDLSKVDQWLQGMKKAKKNSTFTGLLNAHEAFAMYFVGGAADELLAYPTLSDVYCSNLRRLAPLLVALREGIDIETNEKPVSGPYQNSIKLFEIWSARMEKSDLETEKAKLTARSDGIHITNIPVLGTKVRGR